MGITQTPFENIAVKHSGVLSVSSRAPYEKRIETSYWTIVPPHKVTGTLQ